MIRNMYVTVDATTGEKKFAPTTVYKDNIPDDSAILAETVGVFGGVPNDYLVYISTDSSTDPNVLNAEHQRLMNGDEFTGTISEGVVTALDFSIEDAKKWLRVETDVSGDKIRLYEDKTFDTLNVTAKILNADETIDTSFNGTKFFDAINTEGKKIPVEVTFESGEATFQFKPTHYGYYTMPADSVRAGDGEYRVNQQVKVMVYYKAA